MENKYLKTKMYQIILLLILIGSLNWGTTALGYNFVEIIKNLLNNSLKMETYIDKIIYFLVALAGITLAMNRDLWSPCIENFSFAAIIPSASVLHIVTPGNINGSVNLYWSAANATSYKIKARDQLNNTELYRDTNNLSYTFTGLTNGRPYDFSVVGENSHGVSPSSNTLSTTPNINIPPILRSAPLNIRASILNYTATINWAKPIKSSGITGYIIQQEVTLNNQIIPRPLIIVPGENTLSAQMDILPGYIYTIRVIALYQGGPLTGGPASYRITLPSVAHIVPSAPLNVRANISGNTATIIWVKPTVSIGITGYRINVKKTLNTSVTYSIIYVSGADTLTETIPITRSNGENFAVSVAAVYPGIIPLSIGQPSAFIKLPILFIDSGAYQGEFLVNLQFFTTNETARLLVDTERPRNANGVNMNGLFTLAVNNGQQMINDSNSLPNPNLPDDNALGGWPIPWEFSEMGIVRGRANGLKIVGSVQNNRDVLIKLIDKRGNTISQYVPVVAI